MSLDNKELFEETPILKALLRLAIPTVMGQIILVIYNMADTFFISLTNSNVKITAVTVCMPAFMFLTAVSNLFGIGGSSVISRALGKMNTDRARYTSAFSFWGCVLAASVYVLLILSFIDPVVNFLGGSYHKEVHSLARTYIIITIVIGGLFTSMNVLMSHLIRSVGMAIYASTGVILGGVLNILLDPLFMFVIMPEGYEVQGAAAATAISNFISFLFFLIVFLAHSRKGTPVSMKLTKESFKWEIPKKVLSAGLPACVMTFAENLSYAILDNLLSVSGTAVQAGIGVAKKINMLSHSIVRGITQGALPLIGYNYSAGKRLRTRNIVRTVGFLSTAVAGLATLLMLFFARFVVGLFLKSGDPAMDYGVLFLRILCIGAPFSALAYTFISFFQAVGHGGQSLLLALLRKGILDIPMMLILINFFSFYGPVYATPVVDIICSVVAVILFCSFSSRHLSKNKNRKVYNPVKGCYELEMTNGIY